MGASDVGFIPEDDRQAHRLAKIFSRTALQGVPCRGFFSGSKFFRVGLDRVAEVNGFLRRLGAQRAENR